MRQRVRDIALFAAVWQAAILPLHAVSPLFKPAHKAIRLLKAKHRFRKEYLIIKRSGLFDSAYYLGTYPDVVAEGMDPIEHYIRYGAKQRRNPNAQFDSDWYERQNTDIVAMRKTPLVHYIKRGILEGRSPSPPWHEPGPGISDVSTKKTILPMQQGSRTTVEIPLPPPHFILDVGGGDFHKIGEHIVDMFKNETTLQPTSRVLDIGSGCGRVAVPLTRFLSPRTIYHGVDIVRPMVEWCTQNITSRFPNFHFHHADLANTRYPGGASKASSYRFSFADDSFDFIFLTSVFTHLNPVDTSNYLAEICRMLSSGGQVFMTFFILTDEYRRNRTKNLAKITFDYGESPYWINDPAVPEAVSAYEEAYVLSEVRSTGLYIDNVSYGHWNLNRGWTFQDVILASKR